jgi:tetratricopeptide (TPR) repeat protein
LDLRRALLPPHDPATIDSIAHLAALRSAQGDFKAADALFAEAAQAAQSRFGENAVETARHLDNYAGNLDDMGRRNEALALLRRVLAIRERALGTDHADVATTLVSLGTHVSRSGHYDESVALLERALAIRRTIYGKAHPLVAFAQIGLSGAYVDQNRLDQAESLAQEALATVRAGLPANHPKIVEALNMLALIRILRRDYAGAIVMQRHAASAGEDHPDTLTLKNNLAYALVRAGRAAEAETLLRDAIARRRDDNGQGGADIHQNLAAALSLQGKHAEAVEWHRRAVAMQDAREGTISAATAVAQRELAIAREWAGEDAEHDYRTALATAAAVDKDHHIALHGWKVPLAAYLVGTARCDEAVPLLKNALEELRDTSDPISLPQARLLLGACAPAANLAETEASLAQACRALRSLPGVDVDIYPETRKRLATRCVLRTP